MFVSRLGKVIDNPGPSGGNVISLLERNYGLPFSVWESNPRPHINDSYIKDTERNGISIRLNHEGNGLRKVKKDDSY